MTKFQLSAVFGLCLFAAQASVLAQTTVTTTQPAATTATTATTTSSTGNQPRQPLPGCKPSNNQPKKCQPSRS